MTTTGEQMSTVSQGEVVMARRQGLGSVLRAWRSGKGLSIVDAAQAVELSHMTWTRLERGERVWLKTYAAVDQAFHLAPGTTLLALEDEDGLAHFAAELGVDATTVPRPLVVTVAEVIQRLSEEPTAGKQRAVAALLAVLPELAAT
jgi:transcriptional regulator with XRE-family HTH domain